MQLKDIALFGNQIRFTAHTLKHQLINYNLNKKPTKACNQFQKDNETTAT